MTPEEEFNNAVWWTLQEIQLEHLFTQLNGGDIYFEIKDKHNAPKMDNQRRAVEFLERREAIKVINQKYPIGIPQIGAELYNLKPVGYDLCVLQPKFGELYKSYGDSAEIRTRAILETFFDETEQKEKEKEVPTEHSHKNTFDLEKQKSKISAIKFETDFQTAQVKWLTVKNILDAIHRKLPPLEDTEGIIQETVNLSDEFLTTEQRKILPFVLKHAYNNGAVSFPVSKSNAVISSEPARKFIEGESILIEDLSRFESYKADIDELCDFIEKEGKRKFIDETKQEYQSGVQAQLNAKDLLSAADKKKLCVLEKLKEEWDLVPKKNNETIKTDVSWQKLIQWEEECGVDYNQLKNILQGFLDENLIVSFNLYNPAR